MHLDLVQKCFHDPARQDQVYQSWATQRDATCFKCLNCYLVLMLLLEHISDSRVTNPNFGVYVTRRSFGMTETFCPKLWCRILFASPLTFVSRDLRSTFSWSTKLVAVSPQCCDCNDFISYHVKRENTVLKLPPIMSQNHKLIEVLIGPEDHYKLWITNTKERAQREKRKRPEFSSLTEKRLRFRFLNKKGGETQPRGNSVS